MISYDTICAPVTPVGGAIALLRISGNQTFKILDAIFSKKISQKPSHTIHFGTIKEGNQLIDEVLVSLFKSPNSYTGEDIAEISCHGSPYILQKILDLLVKNGGRLAEAGEFTKRAFLNGKLDLTQAEAVADLIASQSKASHEIALNQMRGGISSKLALLRDQLINFTALVELELDFSEEDVEFADRKHLEELIQILLKETKSLISSFDYGNAIKNGVPVAIIGKPNAGKSTLLNGLLNEDRAIVSDVAGTTRDSIEELLVLEGITFRFIDTAGLRQTTDKIEIIGIEKTKEKIQKSLIIIHLYENDTEILEQYKNSLNKKIVFNLKTKADIIQPTPLEKEPFISSATSFEISVKTGYNLDFLKKQLVKEVQNLALNEVIISNARHVEALKQLQERLFLLKKGLENSLSGDLLSIHLKEALHPLATLTGQIEVDKDILGAIFSRFCIGK